MQSVRTRALRDAAALYGSIAVNVLGGVSGGGLGYLSKRLLTKEDTAQWKKAALAVGVGALAGTAGDPAGAFVATAAHLLAPAGRETMKATVRESLGSLSTALVADRYPSRADAR